MEVSSFLPNFILFLSLSPLPQAIVVMNLVYIVPVYLSINYIYIYVCVWYMTLLLMLLKSVDFGAVTS